jgi:hypothetical protein
VLVARRAVRGHVAAELRAGADPQLAVDAREVRLDRLGAYEQGGGDGAVREAGGGQLRDPLLAGRQVVAGAATRAEAVELGVGASGPEDRAQAAWNADRASSSEARAARRDRSRRWTRPRTSSVRARSKTIGRRS